MNIPYDVDSDYYTICELLGSNGLPKNGIPYSVNSSTAKSWPDEKLLDLISKEEHMKEEHGMEWCVICKEYHSMYSHLTRLLKRYIDIMEILADHRSLDGLSYITQTEIANKLNCSPTLISKKMKILQKYGAVETVKMGVYRLVSDSLENTPFVTLSRLVMLLNEKPTLNYKEQADTLGVDITEVQRAWGMINFIQKENRYNISSYPNTINAF